MASYKKYVRPQRKIQKIFAAFCFDGILYIVKTGVQWRMLPSDFAPWQTVYYYFNKWKNEGLLEEIFDTLCGIVRCLSSRSESPSLGIIDSRSVNTSHHGQRGIDGNKKIKGRKEHIVLDTPGLPMSMKAHPTNVHDSAGAEEVFESMRYKFPGLKRILADGGYRDGTVRNTVKRLLRCDLDVVLGADKQTDRFVPITKKDGLSSALLRGIRVCLSCATRWIHAPGLMPGCLWPSVPRPALCAPTRGSLSPAFYVRFPAGPALRPVRTVP